MPGPPRELSTTSQHFIIGTADRTQHRPSPHIRSPESVHALAVLRGAEAGVPYAEAFGVLRTLI